MPTITIHMPEPEGEKMVSPMDEMKEGMMKRMGRKKGRTGARKGRKFGKRGKKRRGRRY